MNESERDSPGVKVCLGFCFLQDRVFFANVPPCLRENVSKLKSIECHEIHFVFSFQIGDFEVFHVEVLLRLCSRPSFSKFLISFWQQSIYLCPEEF